MSHPNWTRINTTPRIYPTQHKVPKRINSTQYSSTSRRHFTLRQIRAVHSVRRRQVRVPKRILYVVAQQTIASVFAAEAAESGREEPQRQVAAQWIGTGHSVSWMRRRWVPVRTSCHLFCIARLLNNVFLSFSNSHHEPLAYCSDYLGEKRHFSWIGISSHGMRRLWSSNY